mgnify:CR=1 FL=1
MRLSPEALEFIRFCPTITSVELCTYSKKLSVARVMKSTVSGA